MAPGHAGGGSRLGTLTVSVRPTSVPLAPGSLPASGTVTGSVFVSYTGASTTTGVISVTLRLTPAAVSAWPFGVVDTPLDNSGGVTGAVPFTGWALDDVGIAAVSVCRGAMPGEAVPSDGRCGPAEIYVADALFIEGARPDVVAAYPTYPRNRQAGWGVMLLTNMLPNQGNGTFWFFVHARDAEGHTTLLGTRTMTCDNAHATLPFGTIDTPAQGETVSGTAYVNFGWALTESPKAIPTDGSTMTTYVDGVPVGHPAYGNYRVDIATLFPGLANSNGAVGFQVLNTTTLSNGLHTIVWTATDSANLTEGLGSRYFTVSNGATALTAASPRTEVSSVAAAAAPAAPPAPGPDVIDALPPATAAVAVHRGWDPDASWEWATTTAAGRVVLRGEEIDRFEVRLGESTAEKYTGLPEDGDGTGPAANRVPARCRGGRIHLVAGRRFCRYLRFCLRPVGRRPPGLASGGTDRPAAEGAGARRSAGPHRHADGAAGSGPAVPGRRMGGGSRRGGGDRHRDAARLGVSADRRGANLRGRRDHGR